MTDEEHHTKETTGTTLDDLREIVSSIAETVSEILDELRDGVRTRSEDFGGYYRWPDQYHDRD